MNYVSLENHGILSRIDIVPYSDSNNQPLKLVTILLLSWFYWFSEKGDVVVVIIVGFNLPVQSVPITTKLVSSNPSHGEVYSI